ncbi:unnamed protein product [Leptidea sinapis]|uniref:Uncharacterized protein n=1 Tax=Leptidea sinapis TaxID=189913 RepID=A0A5E4PU10_9NEOP|nr:unnamed protein product [Leptidea sinapis]
MDIGERKCSDPAFTLSVARTLVQISASLEQCAAAQLGLVERLLQFVWAHLEHHMDSVKHLAAQVLTSVVSYCVRLEKTGERSGVQQLLSAVRTLDESRKSLYVGLTALSEQLGPTRLMQEFPGVVESSLRALTSQPVQASVTNFLSLLLGRHMKTQSREVIYNSWVRPALVLATSPGADSSVLQVLDTLLTTAVQNDHTLLEYILSHIERAVDESDMKCVLMLLSVARKCGVTSEDTGDKWKGLSPKSTEPMSRAELQLLLMFLKYNSNAQAPHCRQLMLALLKKTAVTEC